MMMVAVATLNKDGRVAQTLRVHFATDVIQVDTFTDVTSGILYGRVAVYIA